jgi:hypothetical protein
MATPSQNRESKLRERELLRDLRALSRLPRDEAEENAEELSRVVHDDPAFFAHAVHLLLGGSMGQPEFDEANRILASSSRTDKIAALANLTAMLNWRVPSGLVTRVFASLSAGQRERLRRHVEREVRLMSAHRRREAGYFRASRRTS